MKHHSIEPGILKVFRLFVGLQIVLLLYRLYQQISDPDASVIRISIEL